MGVMNTFISKSTYICVAKQDFNHF